MREGDVVLTLESGLSLSPELRISPKSNNNTIVMRLACRETIFLL